MVGDFGRAGSGFSHDAYLLDERCLAGLKPKNTLFAVHNPNLKVGVIRILLLP